jgi:hypothetical protein
MGRLRIQHRETGEIPALHPAKKGLFIILAFLLPVVLSGQEKSIPISISFFNESTAIPFTRLVTIPVHPGLQVGTEFNYRAGEHSRLFQTVNIGYFYHQYLAQGIGINTELGYEYRLKSGLAFQGLFGVGYMHTFTTAEEFIFSNGQYEQQADQGNARVTPSLSFDLGYYLRKTAINSPKIFVRYQSWAEYPYSPDFIPVMTHINLHLGARFFIQLKTAKHE